MVNSCPVRTQALRGPHRLAVVVDSRRLTFGELDAEVALWAGRLQARGVGPGRRVALLAWNGLAPVALLFAVRRLGATLAPLNARLAKPELQALLQQLLPQCLLVEEALAERLPGGECLESVEPAGGQDEIGTLCAQCLGARPADPGTGAGDEKGVSLYTVHLVSSISFQLSAIRS